MNPAQAGDGQDFWFSGQQLWRGAPLLLCIKAEEFWGCEMEKIIIYGVVLVAVILLIKNLGHS